MNSIARLLKSTTLGFVSASLVVLLPTRQALSENLNEMGPFIKLHGGLNLALDTDFDGSSSGSFPSGDANLKAGSIVGIAGGYKFSRNFSLELEYAYRSNDIDSIDGPSGTRLADGGDLASVAIMTNAYYYFDVAESWSPYIGVGVGLAQEIDSDVRLTQVSDQRDLEDEGFAWQLILGAEVALDTNWRIFGEGRYFTAPSPEITNRNGSYEIDYENVNLLVGVGYQF